MAAGLPISSLTVEQLMIIKGQLEGELQKLTATIQLTNESMAKAQSAKEAFASFAASEPGKEVLVPITESMYVKGIVQETKRPIIELGNGYFAETSVDNATQFFSRRIARLNAQQEQLRNSFKEKQQQYQLVVSVANQKIQASRTQR